MTNNVSVFLLKGIASFFAFGAIMGIFLMAMFWFITADLQMVGFFIQKTTPLLAICIFSYASAVVLSYAEFDPIDKLLS